MGMPDSNGVFDIHEQMDSDLIKLVSNVNSYERENVVRLENSVELLLENLQSCLSKIGLSQGAIESYETGSFITGKDAGTLNTGIKIFGDLHEKNKEAYDEIYETEQKIKDEAEKRKTQGIWRTVGGAVLIATGAACIVLTGGAATPIVADVAVAVGSGTAVFGAADAIEGTQDIYYGSTGDIDSTAVNGIKDDIKCLCICSIRNDSNRSGIYSGKSDIQKHSNNSCQRRHLNGSRSRCAEDNHRCDRK